MLHLLETYKYLIIFPLAIVEGPLVMMVSGLLVRIGFLNFWPAYFLLMAGDLCADVLWYELGFHYGMNFVKKFGRWFGVTEENIGKVKKIFRKHDSKILFISKITIGLGFALVTLITAGLSKVPLRRYVIFNALGGFIWTGFLMGIGLYLGNFYLKVDNALGKISIFAMIVVIFVLLTNAAKIMRSKVEKNI